MDLRIPLEGPPPPPAAPVRWTANPSIRRLRISGALGMALSLTLIALAFDSLRAGDLTLFGLLTLVFGFYMTDTALQRLAASAQAPRLVGTSTFGVHLRMPSGDLAFAWADIRDIRALGFGRRVESLRVALRWGEVRTFPGVAPSITNDLKLAWLEGAARAPRARGFTGGAPSSGRSGPLPAGAAPGAAAPPPGAAVDRPEWTFTRAPDGRPVPDPLYSSTTPSPRSFVWHFVPPSGSRSAASLRVAVILLAGVAVARITADALGSLAGLPVDPWAATAAGLVGGAALSALAWRAAREELAGEVAGSVLFLPAFDRTKAELVASLKEAAAVEGAGDPRERSGRRRTVLVWPRARTRATVLRASYDTRAVVLRTVGQPNFALHARLKGAILDRLDPGRRPR